MRRSLRERVSRERGLCDGLGTGRQVSDQLSAPVERPTLRPSAYLRPPPTSRARIIMAVLSQEGAGSPWVAWEVEGRE